MTALSDIEQAVIRNCLKAFGQAAGEIGFSKPLGDYTQADALRVIEAIVACYTNAMAKHHEACKYPPVRGAPPASDPLEHPFLETEDGPPMIPVPPWEATP